MWLPNSLKRFAAALFLAALAVPLWSSQIARAASDDYDNDSDYEQPASRVGRVSRLDGEASLRQSGSDQWQDVGQNAPVFEGDEFYTGDGSRMEIQLGGGRYLRLDSRTDVVFANLGEDAVRVEVPAGSVIVSLRRVDGDEGFQISAPAAAVTLREGGVYRIDVDGDGNTRVAVHRGSARVSGTERAVDVDAGESARFDYNDAYAVDVVSSAGYYDSFDTWSGDLDTRYDDAYARSDQYVDSINYRNDIYGLAELVNFGSWFDSGQYGMCWRPNAAYGWQPYSNGYWQWYPGYGYTWVSYDRWGWAPYHYGRWAYLNGNGWAWVPWSQYSYGNYNWAPAQVYWCQYPSYGGYAYVPLAPNEPYIDYRRFDNRHHRDFVPQHLRAGRGIGLTQPGSGARLKPVAGRDVVDRGNFGGRSPVGINPDRPKDLTPVKSRFKPNLPVPVLNRPVVVDTSTRGGGGNGRGPVVDRHPTRSAVGDSGGVVVAKPDRGKPKVDDTPTMVDERPVARPAPDRKPVLVTPDGGGRPVTVKPRRDSVDDAQPPAERPKPRRVEPSGPPNDGGSIDRQPRVDREPKVDRTERPKADRDEPRRAEPPREQPKPERNVDRQPKVDRIERVERPSQPVRVDPPPQRDNGGNRGDGGHRDGGGGRNKPNR